MGDQAAPAAELLEFRSTQIVPQGGHGEDIAVPAAAQLFLRHHHPPQLLGRQVQRQAIATLHRRVSSAGAGPDAAARLHQQCSRKSQAAHRCLLRRPADAFQGLGLCVFHTRANRKK